MKIVKSNEATRYENADTCTAFEYEMGEKQINIARVEITGRYPLERSAVNKKVKELVYIESGKGMVSINGVVTAIEHGDVIFIEENEPVWWEGKMTLIISCSPAWTKDQYEVIF